MIRAAVVNSHKSDGRILIGMISSVPAEMKTEKNIIQ